MATAQESFCEIAGLSIIDENPSSFKNSCPDDQMFDNSESEQFKDEYSASKQWKLFFCPHPTCAGDNKWYEKLEQHYMSAHKGCECSLEEAIKER